MLKPMTRVVHFDFHTMPKIDDFGERFDAEAFAARLKDSHVAFINMFARCNVGFSYYPTEIGFPYEGLKGDMLGDTVRACHKRGIGVIGYIHVGLHHELLRLRPDYARMERDGTVYNYRAGANWFRQPCFFGPYVDHVLEEVKEVLALGVDGLFLDGISPRDCACPRCLAEMKKRGMDIASDNDISAFAAWAARDFAERIRALVPENKYLYFKGLPLRAARDLNTHGETACLASNMGYDYFPAQAALLRGLYRGRLYMNGRFGYDWGDFGGYKGKASVENDFFEAIMNGCGTTLGDHLHPAEICEEGIYRDIAEIYGEMERIEKWTEGADYLAEIAILSADGTAGTSHEGAARILSELKYTYNILSAEDDFSGWAVETEKNISISPEIKSIRLDVLFEGETEWYDIEMQVENRGHLPKRSRYYHALKTAKSLKKGENYSTLKPGYVIFICMFDLFGMGEPMYTFEMCDYEKKGLKLGENHDKICAW